MTWQNYVDTHPQHTVVGSLLQQAVWSPQLDVRRDVFVWLPPDYDREDRQYPVIYMHDGQNLFDQYASYAGEWRVDETMRQLSQEGLAAIMVGIANGGERRVQEYSPFADPRWGAGRGDAYLAFLTETLKPLIDYDFRTKPERECTGIIGSSMGGLISLYAFFEYGATFGLAGVMSPSLWFAHGAIFRYIVKAAYQPGALYLDIGGRESATSAARRHTLTDPNPALHNAREMNILLQQKGYRSGATLLYREAPEATHSEAEWAARLPDALRFLLAHVSAYHPA